MISEHRLLYWGILPGLLFQFVGAFIYFIYLADDPSASTMYAVVKILILLWPLVWLVTHHRLPIFSIQKNVRLSLLLGVASGVLILILVALVFFTFPKTFQNASEEIATKAADFGILNFYIPFAIGLSLLHSALEEYYWRWFIFKGLVTTLPLTAAAVVGSFFFAGHHFIILSQFFSVPLSLAFTGAVGVAGFLWCYIYRRTNSLVGSWISHACADAAIMAVGYAVLF